MFTLVTMNQAAVDEPQLSRSRGICSTNIYTNPGSLSDSDFYVEGCGRNMRLYFNERPRTFIVTSDNNALIIRHPFPKYTNGSDLNSSLGLSKDSKSGSDRQTYESKNVIVEFVRKDMLYLSKYRDITPSKSKHNKQILGFLGLLNVKSNIYLGFISNEETVASPQIKEEVKKITGVEFYCLNNDEYDHITMRMNDDLTPGQVGSQDKERRTEYPASSVRKLLSSGCFFYSKDFDMTSNVQERGIRDHESSNFTLIAHYPYFKRFMWNSFMNMQLIEFRNRMSPHERFLFDNSGFLVTMTRGFAKTVNTTVQDEEVLLTLISKQSCIKNGPLFGDWGCDDSGNVSNFVETEVVIYSKQFCFSYVIARGNVPIYWEVENNLSNKTFLGSKKHKRVIFPRSFEASHHALTRHFDTLVNQFGEVHIMNCLSNSKGDYKAKLDDEFKKHVRYFNDNMDASDKQDTRGLTNYKIPITNIPVNTATMRKIGYNASNPYDIIPILENAITDFGALFYDIKEKAYTGRQLGVFRVTSFDSLNKADFISKIISQEVIELAFRDINLSVSHDLYIKHAKLWSEQEAELTKITSSFITYSTKLQSSSDPSSVKNRISKKYLSTVVDSKPRESAMLKLLGKMQDQVSISLHNPINDFITRELNKISKSFTSKRNISVFASTFNVNGSCYKDDIREWLFSQKYQETKQYDLVFIGLQEIVELSAGKMMNPDSTNRIFWETKLKSALDRECRGSDSYVSLWSGQLGGIALFLFVRHSEIDLVGAVEGSFKKTGLGGMSANKGGVAVSFRYCDTAICFVTSHLAAGLSNVDERHQNYKTIAKGIKFSKNRRIRDHDVVLWLGDFNFRIGLPNEQVKGLIEQNEYGKLFEYDQLNKQMANGETFPFFDEFEIRFPPTYKYDNGTKTYDTGEKQRIPAWTDRILSLSRNKIIKQLVYDCAEDIIFSDHRPVYAVFKVSVDVVNETVKKGLSHELYEKYKTSIGDINDLILTNNNLSYFMKGFDENELPPPSSEINKWWLEAGQAVKVSIPELKNKPSDMDDNVINPRLPINPFLPTMEPEFISKNTLMKTLTN